jgi:hypothetical protein
MTTFKEVADVKTADELNLPRPKANFHVVAVEPTEHQAELMKTLSERAAAIHQKKVDPTEDNMLKVTSDGRKIGLDQRLVDPMLPDDPNSKVNACMENIYGIWKETKENKLTQLVFADFSTPNKEKFNVYDDIKAKLVQKGIPETEIAYIHDADSETKKKELFARVRKGQVRVLMGSTAKMGSGTNVQDKLIALHDLDCPWRPADLEQRSGRIIRQGNKNPEVDIYRYVTKSTFDGYLFQTVENKQKFISQIMTSKNPARTCDDVDESVLSYAEVKALCIGDPRIREKIDLDIQVAKLRVLEGSHTSQQYQLQDRVLKYYPKNIKASKERIAGLEDDLKTYSLHTEEKFSMTVSGRRFGEDEKNEAGKAILEACHRVRGIKNVEPIGEYRGFTMILGYNYVREQYELKLTAGGVTHQVELGKSEAGNIKRIENTLEKIPERLESTREDLSDLEKQLENAKEELGRPFPQAQELQEKSARLAELDSQLSLDSRGQSEQEESEQEKEPASELLEQEKDTDAEPFHPQVGQRVVFHPQGSQINLTGKVTDVSDTTVTLLSGRAEIPVMRDQGTFSEAPELDTTQTLEYAQELARQHTGTNGMVFVAGGERTYNGHIVEMTPTFLIQKVEEGVAVLHRLKDLGQENEAKLQKGQNVVINKEAGKVMVTVDCGQNQNSWGNNASMER